MAASFFDCTHWDSCSQEGMPMISCTTLYCLEDDWESVNLFNFIEGGGDSAAPLNTDSNHNLSEDEELEFLLSKERGIELGIGDEENEGRAEAVDWMLKIVGYYSFSALTAVLAVTYFRRFFQGFRMEGEKPWVSQLAAVACLSLAAKVEESQVPRLLDLQVDESKYVFDSKAIQRMELLVLSTLGWKMNPVTPISFLDCIASKLGWNGEFLRRCECLLLSVASDCRFMSHLPSALATATMLYVISSREPCLVVEYQDKLVGILGIDKDKVEACCKLIQEVAISNRRKRKLGETIPGSPKGVMDVSFSLSYSLSFSDNTSNEASWVASSFSSKKIRPHNDDSPKNANS